MNDAESQPVAIIGRDCGENSCEKNSGNCDGIAMVDATVQVIAQL